MERHRGDGTFFQRGGIWYSQVYVDGKPSQKSTGERDERKARKVHETRVAQARLGQLPRASSATIKDLVEQVREDAKLRNLRSAPTREYLLVHLRDFFGASTRLERVTTDRVERFKVFQINSEGYSYSTVRQDCSMLSLGYRLAVRNLGFDQRLIPLIEPPPSEDNVRQGFIYEDEMQALVGALGGDHGDLVEWLFYSSWRKGTAQRIEWRDHFPRDGSLLIRPEIEKTKKPRPIPIAGKLVAIFERRLQKRRLDCPFIFHHQGRPIGDFRKRWRSGLRAAGLPETLIPHDLRRSGIKWMSDVGKMDTPDIMAFSGHRTISTFLRYNIRDLDGLRAAAEGAAARAEGVGHGGRRRQKRRG